MCMWHCYPERVLFNKNLNFSPGVRFSVIEFNSLKSTSYKTDLDDNISDI